MALAIDARHVDTKDASPDSRDQAEDQAASDRSHRCGMGADRTVASEAGPVCEAFPVGTDFPWHALNGTLYGLPVTAVVRHGPPLRVGRPCAVLACVCGPHHPVAVSLPVDFRRQSRQGEGVEIRTLPGANAPRCDVPVGAFDVNVRAPRQLRD